MIISTADGKLIKNSLNYFQIVDNCLDFGHIWLLSLSLLWPFSSVIRRHSNILFLLMLSHQRDDLVKIRTHHLRHLRSIFIKFESGHGFNALILADILRLIDIYFGENDVGVFVQFCQLYKLGSNKFTWPTFRRKRKLIH